MLAIPVANLHLEVYNMKENLATHYVTELNMTYFWFVPQLLESY